MTYAMSPIPRADESQWDAVMRRDSRADGAFVYAVHTTRVYCRPSCPSRRPRRDSVSFFAGPDAAEVAGFRECRRCHPRAGVPAPAGLDQVRRACAWIQKHAEEPITLAMIASAVETSPFHLQRIFTRFVGISPRAYQEAVRAGRFRKGLRHGTDVSGAVYDAGYGSISRVYERRPTGRGMTPAVYRRGGKGMAMTYTIVDSPVGRLMVAGTQKGVCAVKLGDRDDRLEDDLRREYPEATIEKDQSKMGGWVAKLLRHLDGSRPHLDLPIDVQATAFQWKVWRHLQEIPYGETRAYSDVARAIGKPDSVRAVARACATNPVCLVVPCHRVVGKNGSLTGYRWGVGCKKQLLDRERAK
jgi:AraC family transcriptional regulator, regulatory protein of adaptative response / methylated-DNA-[protein]-cysteine methyltransferase